MFGKTLVVVAATALTATQVAALPSPNVRVVPTSSCDGGYSQTGTLSLAGGDNLALKDGTLQKGDDSMKFNFVECTSDLMNFSKFAKDGANVFYGHVTVGNDGDECLAASKLGEDNAKIHKTKCSKSDDSGQFAQFWKLTKDGDKSSLEFFGHINDGRKPYVLGSSDSAVTVSPTGDSDIKINLSSDKQKKATKANLPPTNNRVVERINCKGGFSKSGSLKGGDSPLKLGGSPTVLESGKGNDKFTFTECTSQLLGNEKFAKKGADKVYGILKAPKDKCLRPSGLLQKLAPVEAFSCSYSDDSSQMLQFWQYSKNDNVLSFVGKMSVEEGAKYGTNFNNGVISVSPEKDNAVKVQFA